MKIVVTGATGKLGRLVVEGLLQIVPASQVVAAVRNPDKAADLAARGVDVRLADSSQPETLKTAFAGTQKALLVSSMESGRCAHHQAMLEAAKKARVRLFVYTSVLHAEKSRLDLAADHRTTERLIRASGLSHVILRNGLYIENFTEDLATTLENGAVIGSAGEGRVAGASRADYAAAAVAVLTGAGHEGRIYELAGENPFTMADLAETISRFAGKTIAYEDLPPEDYDALLTLGGVAAARAELLVDASRAIARGEMNDSAGELRRLIGRAPTSLGAAVGNAFGRAAP